MATAEQGIAYEHITRDELREELDRQARERLDITGDEFLVRWRAGRLDEFSPSVARVAVLARLVTN